MTLTKEEINQMWHDWFTVDALQAEKIFTTTYRLLPHDPRCKICASPFEGMGGLVMRTVFNDESAFPDDVGLQRLGQPAAI
jgi:hypothetical protein